VAHPALRVSDADREHAVALLREHHGAGRLTAEEVGERIGLALAARTRADLDAAMEGLPAAPPATALASAATGGYPASSIIGGLALLLLVPVFGRLISLAMALSLLRDERVPARRAQLRAWAAAAAAILLLEVVVILYLVT
jgi:Domain of unknown function (DUF1707)